MTLGEGTFFLPGFLPAPAQRRLEARCREIAAGPVPPYTPVLRTGARMRLRMLCLGRHWNPLTYRYEARRSDGDGEPVPPLPTDLAELARDAATACGLAFAPDVCLLNFYGPDGRLGLHQDKDESPQSLASGTPIVSISLGDAAEFLLGGLRRKDRPAKLVLRSGDAVLLAGASRLRYHGIARILAGTAPPGLTAGGRINLTFRQY